MNRAFKLATLALGATVGGLWLNIAHAASFDCAKARTKVEKLICTDPFISKLDSQLGKVYDEDIAKANPEQKKRLVTDERDWLKNMRDWCTTQTCFKHAYWQRLAELETFYMPHSPMYAKASDKAAAIQKILKTAPLYPSAVPEPKRCREIFQALKDMKSIEFVNPIVQVMSYANPKLVPFRREVAIRDKKRYPQDAPLTFYYACEPNISASWDDAVKRNGLRYCSAYYGLPPFKLFEIPWGKQHPHKVRYIFYSDAQYGPMNRVAQRYWLSTGAFSQNFLYENKRAFDHFFTTTPGAGFEPNYNGLIGYKGEYYVLLVYKPKTYKANPAYWIEVDSTRNKNSCMWFPQKSRNSEK